jgi:hypothetical protein
MVRRRGLRAIQHADAGPVSVREGGSDLPYGERSAAVRPRGFKVLGITEHLSEQHGLDIRRQVLRDAGDFAALAQTRVLQGQRWRVNEIREFQWSQEAISRRWAPRDDLDGGSKSGHRFLLQVVVKSIAAVRAQPAQQ